MLDARTQDIIQTAGIAALSASVSDNVWEYATKQIPTFRDNPNTALAAEIGVGVGMIAIGSGQRRRTSTGGMKKLGELMTTIGIGMITAGVYNLTSPTIGKVLDGGTQGDGNGNGVSGYISQPWSGYGPTQDDQVASLSGYTDQQPLYPNPAAKDSEQKISLGNAHVQNNELNTYQVVS